MNIIFQVAVAVAGTPGPLLGDGAATTVTMITPSDLREPLDSLGKYGSVVNQTARHGWMVTAVQFYAPISNSARVQFGGQKVQNSTPLPTAGNGGTKGVSLPPESAFPRIGNGVSQSINLGDYDVNADASGDVIIVIAEIQ